MELKTVADIRRIQLPSHARDDGELVVIEYGETLPFPALRVFTVRAVQGAVRGRHAHKQCSQFLVCVHGSIEVECDDGNSKAVFLLDSGNIGLLVPPTIWARETYVTADAVLAVLCDRGYEADDYVRDYDDFLAWREADD